MDLDYERPRTRGDCQGGERPCPWVGCTHHLVWVRLYKADLSDDARILRVLERMPETCALDIADRGGAPRAIRCASRSSWSACCTGR